MIINYLRLPKFVYNTLFSCNDIIVFRASNLIVKETILSLFSSFNWLLSKLCQETFLAVGYITLVNDHLFLFELRSDLLDDVWLDALFRGYKGAWL